MTGGNESPNPVPEFLTGQIPTPRYSTNLIVITMIPLMRHYLLRNKALQWPFVELTIDGLIDNGALSSGIREMDLRKTHLLSSVSYLRMSSSKRPNNGR